ncbi:MAG: tRNA pseudouridine(55) synthase TruB [Moorella humiferrea]|uniref:tRNA pseudouridine synthase B n=1 Tax=Neomoorella humiferrea TaxID=676965 RepID=A0A2T0ANC5_9FIRM|nr:tRNA pseudouridine(55) synthase TruB [Moorella humiferrea]MBE3571641.1 tRNA pseudouridine(55) synthase TruB [Moorella humiferrea]PRR70476.1 tRNA pseudouridine synthase B [Moorella humiferrea]
MINGFINVLKPPGPTSHDVVQTLRSILKEQRIGHGGTLDPMAAGVLPIAVGRATRLLEYIQAGGKTYRAEFILGLKTDTQDLAGQILARPGCSGFSLEELQKAALRFTGTITQMPPMVSAVHYKGRRLYELAREGQEVKRPQRLVKIYAFRILKAWPDGAFYRAMADISCSKGTYIRTLGADWGDYLGCGAALAFLIRTRAGGFKLDEAWTLEEIQERAAAGDFSFLLPPVAALTHLPAVVVKERAVKQVLNGTPLKDDDWNLNTPLQQGQLVRLEGEDGHLLAVARVTAGKGGLYLKPDKVFKEKE